MSTGKHRSSTQELTDCETGIDWNARVFYLQKQFERHIFTRGKRIWFHFIFLNQFKSKCLQALTQCNSIARPRLMHSPVLFKKSKHPLQSGKGKATERSQNLNQAVPVSWDLKNKDWYWSQAKEEQMCNSLGCFQKYDTYQWRAYFLAAKSALLCFLASDAWKVLSCLACTCTACRESWKVSAPDAAANQTALYKQEPWGKPNQGNTGAHSCYKLGSSKESQRAWLVPWRCKRSGREHRKNGPKQPLAVHNAAEEGKKSPGTEMTSHINITFSGICWIQPHILRMCQSSLFSFF